MARKDTENGLSSPSLPSLPFKCSSLLQHRPPLEAETPPSQSFTEMLIPARLALLNSKAAVAGAELDERSKEPVSSRPGQSLKAPAAAHSQEGRAFPGSTSQRLQPWIPSSCLSSRSGHAHPYLGLPR
ncbi:hypothetical protein JZ751_003856 [Albula glossodonta]|uniref:Uncharacterized protein n=1 Tax=Albula glossodonta TaxID=121402 RepID=A0A8T2P7H1_9TELE|nr:hypothetical protein JZ751_003856 [Albula glossodonta]